MFSITPVKAGHLGLPKLFEAQVEQSPGAIALECHGKTLTYAQLNYRANALARNLQALGIGRNQLVGLCLSRSIELVVAVLAILKAGAAYLPIDPTYPPARIAYMVINSATPIILTERRCVSLLPTDVDAQMVLLDPMETSLWPHDAVENLDLRIERDDLAYTIYTSGSTGNPKGVAMPHGPLVNLIRWQIDASAVKTGRTLQFSPISFDVSFQEIFATLSTGGTLVLISNDTRRDPYQLLDVLSQCAIDRLFLPFVALNQLATTAVQRQFPPLPLKEVITAGEQLRTTPALVQWFEQMSNCSLYNHYGPSESHVVTAYRLDNTPGDWPLLPAIGHALPHVKLYVLNSALQPVETGELGELYIGGDCLAHGYLHRPDMTAERFLDDPFDPDPTARMYKTGDLVRQGLDGTLDYMGRTDSQVKIRGFRVELGGVEAALTSSLDIRAAAAVARPDVSGALQLVAYVVPQANPASSGTPNAERGIADLNDPHWRFAKDDASKRLIPNLRAFLNERLPSYMVPTQFVVMEALPLTPNDKVDRKALPDPDWTMTHPDQHWVAPTTQTEAIVADIWSQILQVKPIGKMDEFIALGGHSLLVVQLMTQIRTTFDVHLSLGALMQFSRLDQMSQLIDRHIQVCQRQTLDGTQATFRRQLKMDGADRLDAWADDTFQDDGRFGEFIEADEIDTRWVDQTVDPYVDFTIKQDEHLDADITGKKAGMSPFSGTQSSPLNHVFLTGATGLVGGFLLHELLQQTDAQIHCLVREPNAIAARYKLEHYLTQCHIPWEVFGDRIHILPGDLSRPLLGLTPEQFARLAKCVDTIYHSGAQTNQLYPYQRLRGANVNGTVNVLRLASTFKLKAVHHLSTLDVLHSTVLGEDQMLWEDLDLPPHSTLTTGYALTKWVAEGLMARARDRGIPTHIYRLGMTTGHRITGYTNPNDMVARLLRGVVQMQAAPGEDFPLSFTPVNQVAQALVALSKAALSKREQPSTSDHDPAPDRSATAIGPPPTFHIVQTTSTSLQEMVYMLRQQGYDIAIVSYEEWMDRLSLDVDNPLYPFLEDLVIHSSMPTFFKVLDGSQVSNRHFLQQLQQQTIEWPQWSADIFPRYINHLVNAGYLPAARAIAR